MQHPQHKENNGLAFPQEDGASQGETDSFLPEAHAPSVEQETAL